MLFSLYIEVHIYSIGGGAHTCLRTPLSMTRSSFSEVLEYSLFCPSLVITKLLITPPSDGIYIIIERPLIIKLDLFLIVHIKHREAHNRLSLRNTQTQSSVLYSLPRCAWYTWLYEMWIWKYTTTTKYLYLYISLK